MLTSDALPSGAVTFLFTDIEGSTPMWERDADGMRAALVVHDRLLRDAVGAHHGTIFKTGGDSVCAAFADPEDALSSALRAQRALSTEDWPTESPLRVRMGLHTGTAQLRDGDYFGPTLNRVARLMEAGHGGQLLLSSSTHRLLIDSLPAGVSVVDLGTHYFRGLDRPEEVFQVVAPGLISDFDALRTAGAAKDDDDAASAAYQAKDWQTAVDLLDGIEKSTALTAEQHLAYGHSLWWLGKHDDLPGRFEAAYNAAVSQGDSETAAMAAIELAETNHHLLAPEVSRTWERRAEKLLESYPESLARGHLLRWQAVRAHDIDGDLDRALELAMQVMEIAVAHGDGDLETLALQDQGRVLVALGRPDEGMPLMDEAMLAAVAGDVNPIVVGRSYCNMLAVCERTGDVRRASEWSAAAERWCSENESAPYPGVCRIFKAEIMWRQGDWVGAESEVLRASNELGGLLDVAGEAFYQYGEMRLRAGDEKGAEQAFQESLARGRQPVPGYAVLLANRGDVTSAVEILERTLSEVPDGRLDRARFLPAFVDLLIESGRLDEANAAATELEQIAEVSGSELFGARARHARGKVAAARGDIGAAADLFKDAVGALTRLGLPYEAAFAHADLGLAYREDGVEAMARMELKVAASELEKLGATRDSERVAGLVAGASGA